MTILNTLFEPNATLERRDPFTNILPAFRFQLNATMISYHRFSNERDPHGALLIARDR